MDPHLILVWWTLVGLVVGSFLNVAIHRLPLEGETVGHPRRSRCPSCRHELSWRENLPVLSWLLQVGRCRWCRWPIPWRYPFVELLTAGLWFLAAWLLLPQWRAVLEDGGSWETWGLLLIQVVVLSGLVVSTFVDFDHFEIPDEISIGGMVVAPVCSLLVPSLHADTWLARTFSDSGAVDRAGALVGSLGGIAVGGGILLLIGAVGKRLYGREAMGLGDVKLLAAGGGFVGPGGALVALLIGSFVASIAGLLAVVRFTLLSQRRARRRGGSKPWVKSLRVGRIAGRYLPFGPYLGIGIGIVLLAWNDVIAFWR